MAVRTVTLMTCDRCGSNREWNEGSANTTHFAYINYGVHGDSMDNKNEKKDMCEQCSTQFELWWTQGSKNGTPYRKSEQIKRVDDIVKKELYT
jgi:hypothetical protein